MSNSMPIDVKYLYRLVALMRYEKGLLMSDNNNKLLKMSYCCHEDKVLSICSLLGIKQESMNNWSYMTVCKFFENGRVWDEEFENFCSKKLWEARFQ